MKKSTEIPAEQNYSKLTIHKPRRKDNEKERGAALLIALIIIAAFIFVVANGTRTVAALSAEAKKTDRNRQEVARAEYYYSMAEATLKYDIRRKYSEFQVRGKQMELEFGGTGKLPMFDPLTIERSIPFLDLEGNRTGENPSTATSLYGNSALWSELAVNISRTYVAEKVQEKRITLPDSIDINSFKEVYRRSMAGTTEPIYAFTYNVRVRAGEFAEILREDTILLGPTLSEDEPVTADCSDLQLTGAANPGTVNYGGSTQLDLNYVRAERVVIYNQGGTIVYNQVVPTETTPRTASYGTVPLTGPTTFVGEAVRGTCQIQVPIPVGMNFTQSAAYTVNGVQTVNIIEGESVRYDWNITNADAGNTTSWITYGSDATRNFENVYSNSINQLGPSVSTYSDLHVRDGRFNSGSEQTIRVNILVCRLPRITNFTVTPATVQEGGNTNIRFDWETQYAGSVRIVRVSDGQVIHTSSSASSGSWTTIQPQTNTQYRIEALSDCGAPGATATTQVVVTPTPPCPPPVINSFAANPATVTAGGNQTVRLSWNLSGTIDTVSISGIGNVSGTYVDIPQPQTTTTYTLTVTGCGQPVQAQTTVTIGNTPVVTTGKEITLQSAYFGCETGNLIRVGAGFPPAPCVKWMVYDTFSLEQTSPGVYMLTFTSVSNADTHEWFRSKRHPSVRIGAFGDRSPYSIGCIEHIGTPMCYEDRYIYAYWADFGAFPNTPNIVPIIYPVNATPDNTYKFQITMPPETKKFVIYEYGGGANFYTIYYPGFNFGPGDSFPSGEYGYGYPVDSAAQIAVFDFPQ